MPPEHRIPALSSCTVRCIVVPNHLSNIRALLVVSKTNDTTWGEYHSGSHAGHCWKVRISPSYRMRVIHNVSHYHGITLVRCFQNSCSSRTREKRRVRDKIISSVLSFFDGDHRLVDCPMVSDVYFISTKRIIAELQPLQPHNTYRGPGTAAVGCLLMKEMCIGRLRYRRESCNHGT